MSDLVGNPEDRFSHNEAQMHHMYMGINSMFDWQQLSKIDPKIFYEIKALTLLSESLSYHIEREKK